MISIENLKKKEIKIIQNFIKSNYKKNHILCSNLKLFNWLYRDKNHNYNFLVLKNDNKVCSVLGYIPTNNFQKNKKDNFIWLAFLCGRKKETLQGAGISIINFLHKKFLNFNFAVNSIGKKVEPLYKAFGYETVYLKHYYVINPFITQKIIRNKKNKLKKFKSYKDLKLNLINKTKLKKINFNFTSIPKKSNEYFINKYIENPFFNYKIGLITYKNISKLLIVFRVQKHKSSKILRIIDIYGDYKILSKCYELFLKLLKDENSEYMDFLQFGIDHHVLTKGNFELNKYDKIIIPNYFSPYLYKNVRILSAFKSKQKKIVIVKGDGDQDIPH